MLMQQFSSLDFVAQAPAVLSCTNQAHSASGKIPRFRQVGFCMKIEKQIEGAMLQLETTRAILRASGRAAALAHEDLKRQSNGKAMGTS